MKSVDMSVDPMSSRKCFEISFASGNKNGEADFLCINEVSSGTDSFESPSNSQSVS